MIKKILCLIFLIVYNAFSQQSDIYDDNLGWSWLRVYGTIEGNFIPSNLKGKLLGSLEIHYRLNENITDFQTLILRPMAGYKLNNNYSTWAGYAYIRAKSSQGTRNENRFFQMIFYGTDKSKPVVFLGNTRFEQRLLENDKKTGLRLRQVLSASLKLFTIKNTNVRAFFQNEYFFNLNSTDFTNAGFDQNRLQLGPSFKYKGLIVNTTYMNNLAPDGRQFQGVNLGMTINLTNK